MTRLRIWAWIAVASFALGNSGLRAAVSPIASGPAAKTIEQLKPGEFLWAPQIAPAGPVVLIVSLSTQRAFVYRNGIPIGVTTVSSGRKGFETPTGVFTILQKDVAHKSNLYSDAPMPFMQRLTWDGIALHGGTLPGYAASHGCVRLPLKFARTLFGITKVGLTVIVTRNPVVPEIAPVGTLLPPLPDGWAATNDAYHWQPERSRSGPISILVSGRDQRIIILRNGVEIGSSVIHIDGAVDRTEAFILKAIDADGPHWLRLPLPDQPPAATADLTPAERARAHLPAAFQRALIGILQPGATMLVTRESLQSSGTGAREPILEVTGPGVPE